MFWREFWINVIHLVIGTCLSECIPVDEKFKELNRGLCMLFVMYVSPYIKFKCTDLITLDLVVGVCRTVGIINCVPDKLYLIFASFFPSIIIEICIERIIKSKTIPFAISCFLLIIFPIELPDNTIESYIIFILCYIKFLARIFITSICCRIFTNPIGITILRTLLI